MNTPSCSWGAGNHGLRLISCFLLPFNSRCHWHVNCDTALGWGYVVHLNTGLILMLTSTLTLTSTTIHGVKIHRSGVIEDRVDVSVLCWCWYCRPPCWWHSGDIVFPEAEARVELAPRSGSECPPRRRLGSPPVCSSSSRKTCRGRNPLNCNQAALNRNWEIKGGGYIAKHLVAAQPIKVIMFK